MPKNFELKIEKLKSYAENVNFNISNSTVWYILKKHRQKSKINNGIK